MASLYENRGPDLLGVNITFCVLAGVIVILRCYTRAVLVKAFGLDDWTMVLATVCLAIKHCRTWERLSTIRYANFLGFLRCVLHHVQLRRLPRHRAAYGQPGAARY